MSPLILVAGVGNIFLGDDGFGPEVIRILGPRLADDDAVRIADYGIGGLHLAYDLLDDWSALVLVDAVPDTGSPGALHIFEVDHEYRCTTTGLDAHGVDPGMVFASLRALGGSPPRTVVIGCEAADVTDRIGLSGPVHAALPAAVEAVYAAVAMLRDEPALREV